MLPQPDQLVLFLVGVGADALPWEGTTEEVEENMADGLQIVPSRLFPAAMRVDGHVPRRAGKTLFLRIRNVRLGQRVPVMLGHPEIYNVNDGAFGAQKEIIRFNVPINQEFFMDRLYPRDLAKIQIGKDCIGR